MIVNLQAAGWEIIYHRAHALLAAQIAGHWELNDTNNRLYETIAAISHHDDLEKEWEEDQLTQVGAPLDFTLERETSVDQLYRLANEALYRGRWVALLISTHLCALNQSQREQSSEIAAFLDDQAAKQHGWCQELGVSQVDLDAAYAFMRWCDRLSLILCMRQVPQAQRRLEITTGPAQKSYSIFQLDDDKLSVTPWPFRQNQLTVNVEACYLAQLQFENNAELNQALKTAPRELLTWTFANSAAQNPSAAQSPE